MAVNLTNQTVNINNWTASSDGKIYGNSPLGDGSYAASPVGNLLFDNFETGDLSKTNLDGFAWGTPNSTSLVTEVDPGCGGYSTGDKVAIYSTSGVICNLHADTYTDTGGDGTERDWTTRIGSTDKNSLRYKYDQLDASPWSEQTFNMGAPQTDLWMGFWLRVPTNFYHRTSADHGSAATNTKTISLYMDAYSAAGDGPTIIVGFWSDESGGSKINVAYGSGRGSNVGGEYFANLTDVTIGNPVVIESIGHNFQNSDAVTITGLNTTPDITGVQEITVVDANHISVGVNVTAYTPHSAQAATYYDFLSGARCYFDITSHGFVTEEYADFSGFTTSGDPLDGIYKVRVENSDRISIPFNVNNNPITDGTGTATKVGVGLLDWAFGSTQAQIINYPSDQGRWLYLAMHAKTSTDAISADGELGLYYKFDGDAGFTTLVEKTDCILIPPDAGPAGWQYGKLMGWWNPSYNYYTEWLMEDFTIGTNSLIV